MSTPEESYRLLVQQYLKNGELSADKREALEIDRMTLRLLPDQAKAIEQQVSQGFSQQGLTQPNQAEMSLPSALVPALSKPQPKPKLPLPEIKLPSTQPPDFQIPDLVPDLMSQPYVALLDLEAGLNKLEKELGLERREPAIVPTLLVEAPSDPSSSEPQVAANAQSPDVQPTAPPPAAPVEAAPLYDTSLKEFFEALEKNLKASNYEPADKLTHQILLKIIQPEQPGQDWLDTEALVSFSPTAAGKAAIQEIDRLWSANNQKFGFRRQLALYGKLDDKLEHDRVELLGRAQAFSQAVDWWLEPFKFYKLYSQLDFTADAADGHLPAYWFWQLPRSKAFKLGNLGLFSERGGCRVDTLTLPAFMQILLKCGINSAK